MQNYLPATPWWVCPHLLQGTQWGILADTPFFDSPRCYRCTNTPIMHYSAVQFCNFHFCNTTLTLIHHSHTLMCSNRPTLTPHQHHFFYLQCYSLCDMSNTFWASTYLIKKIQYTPGLLSDNSSLVSDDLYQLVVVLVQGSQESRLKWNSCNSHKFSIDLNKKRNKKKE